MASNDGVRDRILDRALTAASAHGLKSLSLGEVARELSMPRSRLFDLFPSNDALQLAVLEHAAGMFGREVIEAVPAMADSRARLTTMFTKWLGWSRSARLTCGCPFVHASAEGDSLPQPVRAKLREILDHWSGVLRAVVDEAKTSGDFRGDADADQLVFEIYGLYLSHHFWHWSMKDANARARTLKAFDRLLQSVANR